jgi:hypothetical protein
MLALDAGCLGVPQGIDWSAAFNMLMYHCKEQAGGAADHAQTVPPRSRMRSPAAHAQACAAWG